MNTLYGFGGNSNDALNPLGGLTSGGDGDFYGASQMGGGTLCQDNGCGAAFRITPAGNENVLTSLTMTQGDQPYGTLILGTDGNFYGTAIYGGSPVHRVCGSGCGTVFRFTRAGVFTTLHRFEGPDGEFPNGGLVQGTDGNFYGTAFGGGLLNEGTIYKLSLGLSPFVKALPYAGPVGGNVTLLGTNLTGATSVKFNGAEAAFTVVSPTEISTTVPAGGTTGSIAVVTPGGTLFSGFRFTVR